MGPRECQRCNREFDISPLYYGDMRDKICPDCFSSVEETVKNREAERARLIENGEVDLDEHHEECDRCDGKGKVQDLDRGVDVFFSALKDGYGPNTSIRAMDQVFKDCPKCRGRGYTVYKVLSERGSRQLESRGLGSDDCDFGKVMGWS